MTRLNKYFAAIILGMSICFFPLFSDAASIRDPKIGSQTPPALFVAVTFPQKVNTQFDVPINLTTGGNLICSAQVNLAFPSSRLEIISLTSGPIFKIEAVKQYSNTNGTVFYTLASKGCTTKDTTLYTVKFRAKAPGPAPIKFTTANLSTVDATGMPYVIPSNKTDNYVLIYSGSTSPAILRFYTRTTPSNS